MGGAWLGVVFFFSPGAWRPNPEFPHRQDLFQFWVLVDTVAHNDQEYERSTEADVEGDLDAAAAKTVIFGPGGLAQLPPIPGASPSSQGGMWPPYTSMNIMPALQPPPPPAAKAPGPKAATLDTTTTTTKAATKSEKAGKKEGGAKHKAAKPKEVQAQMPMHLRNGCWLSAC